MIIALEQWKAGLDTAEMFAGLPGGACQEPHWGYVLKRKLHRSLQRWRRGGSVGRPGVLPPPGPQRAHRLGLRIR
jgi:hypothetical protein